MENMWWIDGIDIWARYGLIIEEGSADLLRLAPRKEGIVHDWREEHGRDYDTTRHYVSERVTALKMGMIAADEATYWANHDAFTAHLLTPGERRLELAAHPGRQYFFIYREWSNITQVMPLTGRWEGMVGQKFTLTIVEPSPGTGAASVALSDEEGRILII